MKLEDHNRAMRQMFMDRNKSAEPSGVDCDNCGRELVYVDSAVLTSYPPKRKVSCPACGFTGYKL